MKGTVIGLAAAAALSQAATAQFFPQTTTEGYVAGDVFFGTSTTTARATFRARGRDGTRPPAGLLNYRERSSTTGNIRYFTMNVDEVAFAGSTAGFTGLVTFSNDPKWQGKRVVVNLSDGGFFGFSDVIAIRATVVPIQPAALPKFQQLQPAFVVRRGDLVVRPKFFLQPIPFGGL